MIVRTYSACRDSERRVVSDNWESVRMLLRDDGMGFSFHITTIYAGTQTQMHYRHHLESVYCISGTGAVENLEDGQTYPVAPGTLYVLDRHDRHRLRAFDDLVLACVFNPPLQGSEVHDAEGVYPLLAEAGNRPPPAGD